MQKAWEMIGAQQGGFLPHSRPPNTMPYVTSMRGPVHNTTYKEFTIHES